QVRGRQLTRNRKTRRAAKSLGLFHRQKIENRRKENFARCVLQSAWEDHLRERFRLRVAIFAAAGAEALRCLSIQKAHSHQWPVGTIHCFPRASSESISHRP